MKDLKAQVEDNLSSLELFPRQWISEIGDRIALPVKPNECVLAFLWSKCGLSKKQVRKLLGNRNGCPVSYWSVERMIEKGGKIIERRIEFFT